MADDRREWRDHEVEGSRCWPTTTHCSASWTIVDLLPWAAWLFAADLVVHRQLPPPRPRRLRQGGVGDLHRARPAARRLRLHRRPSGLAPMTATSGTATSEPPDRTASPTLAARRRRAGAAWVRPPAPVSPLGTARGGAAETPAVAILEEQGRSRVAELVPIRYGRMVASPFAFYRGAAAIMAADLAATPPDAASSCSCAVTPTSRTSGPSQRPTGGSCSASTTSTRPCPVRSSGTSSGSSPASPSPAVRGASRSARARQIELAVGQSYREAMR